MRRIAVVLLLSLAACTKSPPTGVTLRAEVTGGDAGDAATVLRDRLAALGDKPRDTDVAGTAVTFVLPRAVTLDEQSWLVRPGELTFRPVLQPLPPGDCSDQTKRQTIADAATDAGPVTSCAADGSARYQLGPAALTTADVKSARAVLDEASHDWLIEVELRDAGRFGDVTEKYVGQQLAIVLDGLTEAAPTIQERILGGKARISGSFNEATAKAVADLLRYGPLRGRVVLAS